MLHSTQCSAISAAHGGRDVFTRSTCFRCIACKATENKGLCNVIVTVSRGSHAADIWVGNVHGEQQFEKALSIIQNLLIVLLHEYYVPANDDERSFSHIFEF